MGMLGSLQCAASHLQVERCRCLIASRYTRFRKLSCNLRLFPCILRCSQNMLHLKLHPTVAEFEGYLVSDGKCLPCLGMSGRMSFPSYFHNGDPIFYWGTNVLLKTFPVYGPRRVSFVCNSNNQRRNPDFSRRQKGSSRGKMKQFQDQENSENIEEANLSSSENGPLLSLVSNPRYQATATPGRREKEIVELFRKVQVQLRERAAIKEEKKIEAAQQGQAERGTVDSLLKLLRKHSVDQKKKSGGEEDSNLDQPERSSPFEDEQNANIFGPNNITSEDVCEPDPVPFTRPASNFRRKSPVPRVKFQSVLSAEEDVNVSFTSSLKSQQKERKAGKDEPQLAPDPESISVDGPDEVYLGDQAVTSDTDGTSEETSKSSTTEENPDLGSLKLPELKGLAKSRGIKGYSKMKKGELLEVLGS